MLSNSTISQTQLYLILLLIINKIGILEKLLQEKVLLVMVVSKKTGMHLVKMIL